MSFNKQYKLESKVGKKTVLNKIFPNLEVEAGVYDAGILTIFDEDYANRINLNSWKFLLGDGEFLAVAASGIGDLFIYSITENSFHLVETQGIETICIKADEDSFFNHFLVKESVKEDVLNESYFTRVAKEVGENITYGSTYILEPHILLGGKDLPQNYRIGDLSVYVEISGQIARNSKA